MYRLTTKDFLNVSYCEALSILLKLTLAEADEHCIVVYGHGRLEFTPVLVLVYFLSRDGYSVTLERLLYGTWVKTKEFEDRKWVKSLSHKH